MMHGQKNIKSNTSVVKRNTDSNIEVYKTVKTQTRR